MLVTLFLGTREGRSSENAGLELANYDGSPEMLPGFKTS